MKDKNNEDNFETNLSDQNEIMKLLDNFKKNNQNEDYLSALLFYYPILSPENCQKYKINKTKTEEETLFIIVKDLIDKYGDKTKNSENNITNKDLYNYVISIFENPAIDELKNLKIKKIPSRWNNIYTKIIQFESEENNELIFYCHTNDLLANILRNKRPFDNIYFLNEYMLIFQNFKFKNNKLPINTKKFLFFGLCNCENAQLSNGYLDILEGIIKMDTLLNIEQYIKQILDPQNYYQGIPLKIIQNFANSKLASSAFIKIFKSEIPKEIKEEIFTNNIAKYICFFPFSSYNITERTMRRFSLILINTNEKKMIVSFNNNKLNVLLLDFSNIVLRKLIFCHEHQHLSEGLLYFKKITKRLSTPPNEVVEGTITYDEKSIKRGERGELFELLCYGKVYKVYSIFDLLFIADETNDNLDVDEHLKKYKEYHKKDKSLLDELKNFPKGQALSSLVNEIYCELSGDTQTYGELVKSPYILYKNEEDTSNYNKEIISSLEKAENLITPEICPFSEIYF